jgi:uncharacterized OB-fold protein
VIELSSSPAPRNGPARILHEADPDTPLDEIQRRLRTLHRWECVRCGNTKFTDPPECGECGAEDFEKVTGDQEGA